MDFKDTMTRLLTKYVSPAEFREHLRKPAAKTASRKAKRALKQAVLFPVKRRKPKMRLIGDLIRKGPLKTQIVRLLGLLDRKLNGPGCRLGILCPAYARIGPHNGDRAYHIEPQQRGDAARFVPENVIWTCNAANYGEFRNRNAYGEKHIALFGEERIARIKAIAKTTRQYPRAELLQMRRDLRRRIEAL